LANAGNAQENTRFISLNDEGLDALLDGALSKRTKYNSFAVSVYNGEYSLDVVGFYLYVTLLRDNMTFLYKHNCCELSIFLTDCTQHIKAMNICHGE
jgi:hypothetical protein